MSHLFYLGFFVCRKIKTSDFYKKSEVLKTGKIDKKTCFENRGLEVYKGAKKFRLINGY
jgi:hypothetical protein